MKTFTFIAFVLLSSIGLASTDFSTLPPDSVSSLTQKAGALILIEKGKTKFEEGRTREALIKFREAQQKDPNSWKAAYWAGQCHYKLNNYGFALKYSKIAQSRGEGKLPKDVYFLLGESYHRLGKLDSAKIFYEKALGLFSKQRNKMLNVEGLIQQVEFAKKSISDGPKFDRSRILGDVNSGYDDYGFLTRGDSVAYLTARRSNTTGGNLNPSDERFYEDIYKLKWDADAGMWDNITNNLGKLNSNGFDALNWVSPDGTIAYITLNNSIIPKTKKPTRSSDICEVKKNKNGTWNSPKPIKNKSINTSFFDGAATLTADGNTMYFVSDRKANKSLTDIYVVHKDGKSWGTAKPLPENINTPEKETTPFITPDGKFLFFASEGHRGMGGYDIFVSENLGDSWSDPVNLGYGVNSVNNDTHFSYNPETKKGYVSSYHIVGNKSSIDIYEIDFSNGMPFIKQ